LAKANPVKSIPPTTVPNRTIFILVSHMDEKWPKFEEIVFNGIATAK
jgi:hypothetical protein